MRGPSLYIYFQIKMAQKCDERKIIELPFNLVTDMFMRYKIPKKLHRTVLKEMAVLKLIELGRDSIKIINCQYSYADSKMMTRLTKRRKQIKEMLIGKEGFFDF